MSTTPHAHLKPEATDSSASPADSLGGSIKIHGSIYVYTGLTLGSGVDVVNGGNAVFVEPGAYLTNYGTVSSTSRAGVSLYSGATLTNDGTVTSQSGAAVTAAGGGTYIDNNGIISSVTGAGVVLSGVGTLMNSGAIRSGANDGVAASAGTATITNYGTITGAVGVALAGGTLTNAGTIGGSSYAVTISGTGTLVDDAGSVFNGSVAANPGGGSVLDLAGSGYGTLAGLGTQFTGFGTLNIESGTWTVQNGAPFYGPIYNYSVVTGGATGVGLSVYNGGFLYNAAGATITASGASAVAAYGSSLTIVNDGGYITSQGAAGIYLTGSGTIDNYGGTISSASGYGIAQNGGTAYIDNTGNIYGGNVGVEIADGTITTSGTISGGSYAVTITGEGTLVVDPGAVFYGQVAGTAGYGDVLDLAGTGQGTLAGLGTQITGFDTLSVTSGTWAIQSGGPSYGLTINNYSTVTGGATGVGLSVYSSSSLYNASGAQIVSQGAAAVSAYGSYIGITNDGLIAASGGFGVYLSGSGSITNAGTIVSTFADGIGASGGNAYVTNTGTITGGNVGVYIASGTITNDGTITGGNYAVYISGTGTLVDYTGSVFNGVVAAYAGGGSVLDLAGTGTGTLAGLGTQFTGFDTLTITSGTWTVQNGAPFYGTINNYSVVTGGATGVGLSVYSNSSLYNASGAQIVSQGAAAVSAYGSNVSITNDGLISAAGGFGVYLSGSGSVTNAGTIVSTFADGVGASGGNAYVTNTGTITGGNVGVYIANGTITNDGTITGGNYAVYISGTGTLVVDDGAAFYGQVAAAPGGFSVLELAGYSADTLTGLGTQFTGFSTVAFETGSNWTVDALASVAATTSFTGDRSAATLDLTGGGKLTANESGFATLQLSGGTVFTQPASFSLTEGLLSIDAGSKLIGVGKINAAVYADGTIAANTNSFLRLAMDVTGSGTLSARAGGTLAVSGGFDWSGAFSGPGTISLVSSGTIENSSIVTAATIRETASVTLAAGAVLNDKTNSWNFVTNTPTTVVSLIAGDATSKLATQGTITASGPGTTNIDTALQSTGQVLATSGTLSLLGSLTNGGTMSALGGSTLNIATSVAGTGTINIGASSLVDLVAGAGKGQLVDFLSSTGALDLGKPSALLGTITGFAGSDVIDLLNTSATGLNFVNNTLKVLNGNSTVASLHFSNGYSANNFSLASDGHGGELITFK